MYAETHHASICRGRYHISAFPVVYICAVHINGMPCSICVSRTISILKFYSFNSHFVSPSVKHKYWDDIIILWKEQWRSGKGKCISYHQCHDPGPYKCCWHSVCTNMPVHPPHLHRYMHTYAQIQRLLCSTADGSSVLQGKLYREYFSHLSTRNAQVEVNMKGISGAAGIVGHPSETTRGPGDECSGLRKSEGPEPWTWAPAWFFAHSTLLAQGLKVFGPLFFHMLMNSFIRGTSNSNSLSF